MSINSYNQDAVRKGLLLTGAKDPMRFVNSATRDCHVVDIARVRVSGMVTTGNA